MALEPCRPDELFGAPYPTLGTDYRAVTADDEDLMGLPTTRYGRRKYRAWRFAMRRFKWEAKRRKYGKTPLGQTIFLGLHPIVPLGPKQSLLTSGSASYTAAARPPDSWVNDVLVFHPVDADTPPHFKNVSPAYRSYRNQGQHGRWPFSHYHVRRRARIPAHVKLYRRTARERKITGANWRVFRNGYFPDWDILGRRPNDTDAANGVPPYPHSWPQPLGY